MEITVKVVLTADSTLTDVLKNLLSATPGKTGKEISKPEGDSEDAIKEVKAQKAVKKEAAKEKAAENGAIDLSTIRQYLAKSEANKTAARELLKDYDVEKLTDLDKADYADFYTKLTSEVKDDL